MNRTERPAKTPSTVTGAFATPCASDRGQGTGAPSISSAGRRGVLALIVSVTALLLLPSASALAAGKPPQFLPGELHSIAYPTRVTVVGSVKTELTTKWKAEYAQAKPGCEPPLTEASCDWAITNEGTEAGSGGGGSDSVYIGAFDEPPFSPGTLNTYLRHLAPETSYYVRFIAENADGTSSETVPIKTLSPSRPEIPLNLNNAITLVAFESHVESDSAAGFTLHLESDGSETTYQVEYALPENGHAPVSGWKLFSSGATGTITTAQEHAFDEARVTELEPETTYYVRLKAVNKSGELVQTQYASNGELESTFTTLTAKPKTEAKPARNVTAASAHLWGEVVPHGHKTTWQFESATSPSGPWTPVPEGAGTISQEQAEALGYGASSGGVGVRFEGLHASTEYYYRLIAENECKTGCGPTIGAVESFQTAGAPSVALPAAHAIHEGALRLLGSVNPNSLATSAEQTITVEGVPTGGNFTLTFKGQTTAPIASDASAGSVLGALNALSTIGSVVQNIEIEAPVLVEGPPGGPYTVAFEGSNHGLGEAEIEANGLGLVPSGTVTVAETQAGGIGYDTHYHFSYVSQKQFETSGWAGAAESPELDAGSGATQQYVGADLPGLTPGETYRYRLVASNTAPGTGLVESSEATLTAPAAASAGEAAVSCPNEAFRTGFSAGLPDCRAYEMITPVDKEGTQELMHYGGSIAAAVPIAEDGERVAVESSGSTVHFGSGLSPYTFSRGEGQGWSMSPDFLEPEAGVSKNEDDTYSADLSRLAFRSNDATSTSAKLPYEYKIGPAGGPYKSLATIPYQDEPNVSLTGWVAQTPDLSKLVLASEDRTLVGEEPTGTKSGADLYEYTAGSGLRQLNVTGEPAATVGKCGARMPFATVSSGPREGNDNDVSADGSHVFFEAIPGHSCSETRHLYLRMNGETTVDIGAYSFVAANPQGSEVLVESPGELWLYNTETHAIQHVLDGPTVEPRGISNFIAVSEDLSVLYANFSGALYRYDVSTGTGTYLMQAPGGVGGTAGDGRYYYFEGSVAGLPGGGIMRYDSAQDTVECLSCASSFDPEPKLPAFIRGGDGLLSNQGLYPVFHSVSESGDYAFFATTAALVPQDLNGEVPNEFLAGGEFKDQADETSTSSDVYEWRKDGINGCGQLQGCLSLITNGRNGYFNQLLGTTDEGRDVFFATRSSLGAQDTDTAEDVYDARIGGGSAPPPARPVECENNECSNPPPAPNDLTPSSLTFSGNGNTLQAVPAKPAVKPTKPKPKKKVKKKKTGKKGKKQTRKAKKSTKRSSNSRRGK
jgi:hypothetical protein